LRGCCVSVQGGESRVRLLAFRLNRPRGWFVKTNGDGMRIATVVGARPQLIKAAVVSRKIREHHEEILIHTGQHYDTALSAIFFDELGLPVPDVNLQIGSASHGLQTARMLTGLEREFQDRSPSFVLLYGDTNSTLAGAIAAAKMNVPIGHVEAGVRHYDRSVPEEVNRVLTDHVSSLSFCPTRRAVANLAKEGVEDGVHWTGDVMYDSVLAYEDIVSKASDVLSVLDLSPGEYYLATVHRASNTDVAENLREILTALGALDRVVVLPLHPRTRKVLDSLSDATSLTGSPHLKIIDPQGYLEFLALEKGAQLILTDSGGVQKEAYFLRVPCITLRTYSPWPETVSDGWNTLVPPRRDEILAAVKRMTRPAERGADAFGDGRAAVAIRDLLDRWEEAHA